VSGNRPIKISASLMCADLRHLEGQIREMEAAGVDWLHFDIMDGHFVPNFTLGPHFVQQVNAMSDLPCDVHLMVEEPDPYIGVFVEAGADVVVVHQEACRHLDRTLQVIRSEGAVAGVALNPATPLNTLEYVVDEVDLVLIMTVNPGFAGQALVPATMRKIAECAERLGRAGREIDLQVDGNVSPENARRMCAAGANVLVAGSASLFRPGVEIGAATAELRQAAEEGAGQRGQ
jgi:ribulose-phosphate 3-epimerase